MGIRMSGIVSGLDTEGIIKELMKAKSLKKTKIEGTKTKLEWKQEKWAELNTKLYKLYTDYANKLRLTSNYNLKKSSAANESIASVKGASNATNGSYTLDVTKLATSQYVTSGKVVWKDADGNDLKAKSSTKLAEMDSSLLNKEITIENGGKTTRLQITADTKISDLVQAYSGVGLNASFDEGQQRFFISSKTSGLESVFSFTSTGLSSEEVVARQGIRNALQYESLGATDRATVDQAFNVLSTQASGSEAYEKAKADLQAIATKNAENETTAKATSYVKAGLYDQIKVSKGAEYTDEALKAYYEGDNLDTFKAGVEDAIKADLVKSGMAEEAVDEAAIRDEIDKRVAKAVDEKVAAEVDKAMKEDAVKEEVKLLAEGGVGSIPALSQEALERYGSQSGTPGSWEILPFVGRADAVTAAVANVDTAITEYAGVNNREEGAGSLASLGLANVEDGKVVGTKPADMSVIEAQDSEITLNGATLTSSGTTFNVNGLTIELKSQGTTTFSVSNDVEGVYNMVKDFLGQYNEITKEMNALFKAKSSRGYDPLTDEEKEAMSEKQIELWEGKIKDSLLRNDETLRSVTSSMRNAMMSSVEIDGKKYSLADLGIMTSTDYTEGGLLHIFGNADDATYSDRDDKLMKMLTEDSELAIKILSGVTGKLNDAMFDKMKTSTISSAFTFYNDKQMNKQKEEYEDQVKLWESRLLDMENRYYKQFTAMEKAMSKLNSQSNYFSNLMGGQ